MELRSVRYALAVAESLHFGRAAEQMHVAQPSLSRQVAALEREIGAKLFERSSRQVALTAAGAAFASGAHDALARLNDACERARQADRGQLGELRLGFIATAALDVLPSALSRYRSRYPDVSVSLTECPSGPQVELLMSGELDVAIGRDVPAVAGLTVDVLDREPMMLSVSQQHPLASRKLVTPDDIAPYPLVRLRPGLAPRADVVLALVAAGAPPDVRPAQEAQQYMTLLALVAAGIGAAVVPRTVSSLRSDIIYVPIDHAEASSTVTVAHRKADPNPLVAAFCRALTDGPD